jgi:hypothetical protein
MRIKEKIRVPRAIFIKRGTPVSIGEEVAMASGVRLWA